jgi:hypothetical protein
MATAVKPRAKARTSPRPLGLSSDTSESIAERTIADPSYHWERTSDGYAECAITASAECSAEWAEVGHHRRVKVEISGREDDKREVRVWFFDNGNMTPQQHATLWCDGSFALDMLHEDDVVRLHEALGRAIGMAKRVGLCDARAGAEV